MEDCPSPQCKLDIIKCMNRKVSKSVLGTSLAILVAAASTIAFLSYSAYDSARDVLAAETVKAKVLAETNREKINICDSNARLISQSLKTIDERLREMKSDQKEVNKKVLDALEELNNK